MGVVSLVSEPLAPPFCRLKALQALQHSLLQAEDIVKVHEARLTEKETSSLESRELDDYRAVLKVAFLLVIYLSEPKKLVLCQPSLAMHVSMAHESTIPAVSSLHVICC